MARGFPLRFRAPGELIRRCARLPGMETIERLAAIGRLSALSRRLHHIGWRREARLSAIIAEAESQDPWTSRARPSFLYVMYALILFSVPMGIIAAFDADAAKAIGEGMTSYLAALPEALYALFGTGYLGYTAARQWGKVKGVDR